MSRKKSWSIDAENALTIIFCWLLLLAAATGVLAPIFAHSLSAH